MKAEVLVMASADCEELQGDLLSVLASDRRLRVTARDISEGQDVSGLSQSTSLSAVICICREISTAWTTVALDEAQKHGVPAFALIGAGRPGELQRLLERGFRELFMPPVREEIVLAHLWRAIRPDPPDTPDWMRRLTTEFGLRAIVGESPSFREQIDRLPLFAGSDAPVLIRGETGTGKEVVARALHYTSPRADGPFVPVNCGAIPLELMESELFGHERAAFTGASAPRVGLIEEADGGTLFLDELDSLIPGAQVKLLRFLQEGEYRRLGSSRLRNSDARVVAAMSSSPSEAIRDRRLRRDVYYRIGVLLMELPPLRERRTDVLPLAEHFLQHYSGGDSPRLSSSAREALMQCDWEGNVRELQHVVQRAVLLSHGSRCIEPRHLGLSRPTARAESYSEAKKRVVDRFERAYVEKALALVDGNVSEAARKAQRSRRGFWTLVKKHGIDVHRFRQRRQHQRRP